jgi:pimeloyl-ACP methyl ester carboxylesterase
LPLVVPADQDGAVSERYVIERDGGSLVGERWPGDGQLVVLLHEGVSDRRGWRQVAELLAPEHAVVAYDRRGYGESPLSAVPFRHLDDLLAVVDREQAESAWLVGASAGGGLALDAALAAPDRVAGLVVIGTAVSGAPEPVLDPATAVFDKLLDAAIAAGDHAETNRLETWLWLDGPSAAQGRVGGPARELALDMNAIIIANQPAEADDPAGAGAWHRLDEIRLPVTVACGDLDVPFILERCRYLADRLPDSRYRELSGLAHQPYLEDPRQIADLIRSAQLAARAANGPRG